MKIPSQKPSYNKQTKIPYTFRRKMKNFCFWLKDFEFCICCWKKQLPRKIEVNWEWLCLVENITFCLGKLKMKALVSLCTLYTEYASTNAAGICFSLISEWPNAKIPWKSRQGESQAAGMPCPTHETTGGAVTGQWWWLSSAKAEGSRREPGCTQQALTHRDNPAPCTSR